MSCCRTINEWDCGNYNGWSFLCDSVMQHLGSEVTIWMLLGSVRLTLNHHFLSLAWWTERVPAWLILQHPCQLGFKITVVKMEIINCVLENSLSRHLYLGLNRKSRESRYYLIVSLPETDQFILEEQVTLINAFWVIYNSLSTSRSSTYRILFNAYNSSTNTSFTTSSLCKVLVTFQN